MPFVIGTAGHIDHGKTTLVKALTGQDTDRTREEKERGISIHLGFAHLDLSDGTRVGVVDVPGHERFIRNMLAGAHGIDLALFTVAADDGVMPQTEEHLDILHLLGIQRAIFVLTKADLVAESRLRDVEEEIQILTSGTSLEDSPVIPFSFVTGRGLEQIRDQISQILQRCGELHSTGYFRLPVDRVFSMQGHGLIVTGTALSGVVKVDDRVRCLPGGKAFRVRSVHVHDQPVEIATAGQRIALNLTGQERPSIGRGHVICHEKITLTSDRFDAFLETRPMATAGIKSHQRVRVHLGTAERLAKLILLGAEEKVGPKQSTYCQIVLNEPLLALRGDRFIIRDETAQRTLGGGVVLHPWAKKHKRSEPDLRQKLELLHSGDVASLIEFFLSESDDFAVSTPSLRQFLNRTEEDLQDDLQPIDTIRVFSFEGERLYATEKKRRHLETQLLETLRGFHASHPLAPGMDMEGLREKLCYRVVPKVFRGLVEQLEIAKAVMRDGNLLRLPEHKVRLRDEEKIVVERIQALLGKSPLAPPDVKQVETETGIPRARLMGVIRVMEREKTVIRVGTDMYFLRDSIERVTEVLQKYLSENEQITPAVFRELFGTTRKYTIPLLEYFDREGITVRIGDARRLKIYRQPK